MIINGLTLFSHHNDYVSHSIRLALSAKNIAYQLILVEEDDKPADLVHYNPYNTLPTLVDKDVQLYYANVMLMFLEERYRQQPLLPISPTAKAKIMQYAMSIENDWLKHAKELLKHPDSFSPAQAVKAKQTLTDSLISLAPLFAQFPYFLSEQFGYLDCLILPVLWRLPLMDIQLSPSKAMPILQYMQRMFALPVFTRSLTQLERQITSL